RLLALVSAPPLQQATVRHVELLLLQPQVAMLVVITSAGGVTKRIFTFGQPVDPGLTNWASEYLNDQLTGLQLGTRALRRKFDDPTLPPRDRRFAIWPSWAPPTELRTARSARSASSARCAWTTSTRSAPCARQLPSSRAFRRRSSAKTKLGSMATTQRDYYEVLGVARSASEQEIKKAFRQLARGLHPDVSDAPDAEDRFKEVVE